VSRAYSHVLPLNPLFFPQGGGGLNQNFFYAKCIASIYYFFKISTTTSLYHPYPILTTNELDLRIYHKNIIQKLESDILKIATVIVFQKSVLIIGIYI